MSRERALIAEQAKLQEARKRLREVAYMTAPEVRKHLNMSRATLDAVPFAVLPWVPGNGSERVARRYHPADVAAYQARARRWKSGGDEALEAMKAEIAERDARLMDDAIHAA